MKHHISVLILVDMMNGCPWMVVVTGMYYHPLAVAVNVVCSRRMVQFHLVQDTKPGDCHQCCCVQIAARGGESVGTKCVATGGTCITSIFQVVKVDQNE